MIIFSTLHENIIESHRRYICGSERLWRVLTFFTEQSKPSYYENILHHFSSLHPPARRWILESTHGHHRLQRANSRGTSPLIRYARTVAQTLKAIAQGRTIRLTKGDMTAEVTNDHSTAEVTSDHLTTEVTSEPGRPDRKTRFIRLIPQRVSLFSFVSFWSKSFGSFGSFGLLGYWGKSALYFCIAKSFFLKGHFL